MQGQIVVVGAGVAGLCAAVAAAEKGSRVLVFEKQRALGGTSNFFQGTFAVESDLQRRKFIFLNKEDVFRNIMEYTHWKANPRLVREIVEESAKSIKWLEGIGVKFADVICNLPVGPQTYHIIEGGGAAVIKRLAERARELGVVIQTGSPVKRIIRDRSGVRGVVVENADGEDYEYPAKAVVIASGGYANNASWIKKYCGFELGRNLIPVGNVGKMGDGIRMAWEVGAAEEGMGTLEIFRTGPIGGGFDIKNPIEVVVQQPYCLWINPLGERFCDESIVFFDTSAGNANSRYKYADTFTLFDDHVLEHVEKNGIVRYVGLEMPPGYQPHNVRGEIERAVAQNSDQVYVAESLSELARKMNVPTDTLVATVAHYNECCKIGYDDLFFKPRRFMLPLKGPRYYAVRVKTVCLGTMGGIKINYKMQVVDETDRPIPGLYAAGYDAGGMYGDSYPINVATGLSSAFAINSGVIAGREASAYVLGRE